MVALFKSIAANKNIVIGGGGLWGRDVNINILFLSLTLFFSRYILRKNVYLIGVGYYNSTNTLGSISAWFAGKAASYVLARDIETRDNFLKHTRSVGMDDDIAMSLNGLDLKDYQAEAENLEKEFKVKPKNVFVTIRRLKGDYGDKIEALIKQNPQKNFLVMILEPRGVDPEGYMRILELQRRYNNVVAKDFDFNPIALFLFFKRNAGKLTLVGPQFHIIITAYLANISFMPLIYDNKVEQLLMRLKIRGGIQIHDAEVSDFQSFIDSNYGKRGG
jgi:polysaccharide pyruvyl transferase WcaK-like protein